MKEILSFYIEQISEDAKKSLSASEIANNLLVLSDSAYFFENKKCLDEILYIYMDKLRTCLKEDTIYHSPSMYGGLAELALSIYSVNQQYGYFKNFLDTVNELLILYFEDFLNYLNKKNRVDRDDFDFIFGITGVLNYFYLDDTNYFENEIRKGLRYLVERANNIKFDNNDIIGYFTPSTQNGEIKNGSLDLGVAHGISGPLIILSKYYEKGIIVKKQKKTIRKLLNQIEHFSFENVGLVYWPTEVSYDEYIKKTSKTGIIHRESWCYGSINIAYALLLGSKAIEDNDLMENYKKIIADKLQREIKTYQLSSPIVCHGYASIIVILKSLVKNVKLNVELNGIIEKRIYEIKQLLILSYNSSSKYGFIDKEYFGNEYIEQDTNDFLEGSSGVVLTLLLTEDKSNEIFLNKLLL